MSDPSQKQVLELRVAGIEIAMAELDQTAATAAGEALRAQISVEVYKDCMEQLAGYRRRATEARDTMTAEEITVVDGVLRDISDLLGARLAAAFARQAEQRPYLQGIQKARASLETRLKIERARVASCDRGDDGTNA